MSDEAALLKAIIAQADEDTPRLVYADWLDENSDPERAEFIRVQCRLANLSPSDPDWVDLVEREAELVGPLYRSELTKLPGPFNFAKAGVMRPSDNTLQDFHRGFPFFCLDPFRMWAEKDVPQFAADLTALVKTTTVRALEFQHDAIPATRIAQLVNHPSFDELRGLALPFSLRKGTASEQENAWEAFAEAPVSRYLTQLRIPGELSVRLMRLMTASPSFRKLQRFEIPELGGMQSTVREWLAGGWTQGLRHARVTTPRGTDFTLAGLAELPELHSLVLTNMFGRETKILAAGAFPKLASLVFSAEGCTIANFRELLAAKWFGQVRALKLWKLGDQALSALANHEVSKELRGLWFADNPLAQVGLRALTKRGAFPSLVSLDLTRCVGPKKSVAQGDVLNFLSTLALPGLKRLNLRGWPLSDKGADALASNPALTSLTHLDVAECQIGERGQKALTESPHLRAVIKFTAP